MAVENTKTIMEICLLAGRIMMEGGAETYRVEDTMTRIAASFGMEETHCFVTPTGIFMSLNGDNPSQLVRINVRTTDLEKVARVNQISRRIAAGEFTVKDAKDAFEDLEASHLLFPISLQILAAALVSGSFLIMFKGGWTDFLPAIIAGGLGYCGLLFIQHYTKVKFFAEFFAAFIIGIVTLVMVNLGIGKELDKIIIGSVMPLVPGLLITNAVRDLMAGHFVSGLSKGAEAFLTAFAIGAGVAVVFLSW
ncbi:Inner membrane protein YjjP [Bacillus sp. THAF10]|uniref:threonine/serine exporter family protein n=1 Tax=Bacillus sp. THAF10 TaxID=2587848 RepID=UPI001267E84B|nr:threonine/serine exporter family protein [Bacillus sp. THAF10]QFT88637.1 Inner membrane protein YjjP [Bacillus sp. THAF10]